MKKRGSSEICISTGIFFSDAILKNENNKTKNYDVLNANTAYRLIN